jgi:hypothetical protein
MQDYTKEKSEHEKVVLYGGIPPKKTTFDSESGTTMFIAIIYR